MQESVPEETIKDCGERLAKFLGQLEHRLSTNGGKPFFAGEKVSIGDIKCHYVLSVLVFGDAPKYAPLVEHMRAVANSHKHVHAWCD